MRILLFILLMGVVISCKKKHTVHIKVINPATGQVYIGLKYRISQEKTILWDEKTKVISSGELNENGEANATFRRGNHPIRVQVEWPSNSCYSKNDVYYIKGDGPNHEVLVEFTPCAYLKQNITNINCQGSSDHMILYTKNQVNSLGVTGWEFHGCNGYVGDHFSNVPMGKYYFEWHVTRNGITNVFYDTINLSSGEYKVYDINY